jgi:tetratricopeptide (TPR) repeat protein
VNDAREALGVFTYLQDWASMGRCHNFLAQALEQLGQRNEALRHQQIALDLLRKARNHRGVAVVLNGLGVIYYKSGNLGMALRCYWQALRLSDSLKSVVHQGTALNNIANVYDDLGRQETAVAFYERNLALLQNVGVPSAIALAHMQIGNMYLKMDQLSKAEHHLREALALQKKIDDRRRQVFTNSYLGRVYFQRHERAVALYYFLEAYEQARSLGTLEIAIDAMKGLFHYYRYEGKEELAGHYLFEALQTATRYGDRLALLELYDLRATFEQQRRKPEAAALWKERYLHLRDSLFTPGLGKTVDSLEMAYENEMRSILLTKPPPPSSARLREENKSLYGTIRWITLSLLTLLVVLLALGRHRGAGPHQREQKKAADAIATT